jgi:transcriptional regulator with XRE-family HTH domain
MITTDQIRAARALLRLDQADVARRASVSVTTIRRLENAYGKVAAETVDEIRRVLEAAGAEFVEGGVRRRDRDSGAVYTELRAVAERSAECLRGLPAIGEADLYDEQGLPA